MNNDAQKISPEPVLDPIADGSLLTVPGLNGAGVACGLKPSGQRDLAIVSFDPPFAAAGMFTKNKLVAAPVVLTRDIIARTPHARALVINSGNANAITGDTGLKHARQMIQRLETHCGGPALVLSTGIIGVPLPIHNVLEGIDHAISRLGRSKGLDLARAIMTTDTRPKTRAVRV